MSKAVLEDEEKMWAEAQGRLAAAEEAARAGAGAEEQARQFSEAAEWLLQAARSAAARAHEESQALQRLRSELAQLHAHQEYLQRAEVTEEWERERMVLSASEPAAIARAHRAMMYLAYLEQRLAEHRWRYPHALRDDDGDDADDEWHLRSELDALDLDLERLTRELEAAEAKMRQEVGEEAERPVRPTLADTSCRVVPELERQQGQVEKELEATTRHVTELQQALDECRYVDRRTLPPTRSVKDLPLAGELREARSLVAQNVPSGSASLLALLATMDRSQEEAAERVDEVVEAWGKGRLPPADAASQLAELARALAHDLGAAREALEETRGDAHQLRDAIRLQQHKNEMLLYLDAEEEAEEMTAAGSKEALQHMRTTMYQLGLYELRIAALHQAQGEEFGDDGDESDNTWQLQARLDHRNYHIKLMQAQLAEARKCYAAWAEAGTGAETLKRERVQERKFSLRATRVVLEARAGAAALAAAEMKLLGDQKRLARAVEHKTLLQRALDLCRSHRARQSGPGADPGAAADDQLQFEATHLLTWAADNASSDASEISG